MRILSLDQSTTITGFSIWEDKILATYGTITSKEKDIIERLSEIYSEIKSLIQQHRPDFVVLEGVQFQSNQKTYNQLSQLQGVIFSILFEEDIGFCIVEPSVWRKYSDIKGRKRVEQKLSAIDKVKQQFSLDVNEDVAESILIGVWAVRNIQKGAG
jgi:Holliday junction resolvasome RuvABC endonuclease subunit